MGSCVLENHFKKYHNCKVIRTCITPFEEAQVSSFFIFYLEYYEDVYECSINFLKSIDPLWPIFPPAGVIAYSIGIAWAAQDELEAVATDPDKEHSFFVDEFDRLYRFVSKIVQNICTEFNSQPRN